MNIEERKRKAQGKIHDCGTRNQTRALRRYKLGCELDTISTCMEKDDAEIAFQRGMIAAFEIMAQQQNKTKTKK